MFSALGFTTLFEIILVAFVIWAIFNEDKFIAFEKRLLSSIRRRRLKVLKSSNTHNEKVFQQ